MNEHTLKVLEYAKLRDIIAGYALSEPGKRAIASLLPSSEKDIVEKRLRETKEFTAILASGETPPLDGIRDIQHSLTRLTAAGSVLAPGELLAIAETLGAGRRVKVFFQKFQARSAASTLTAPLLCGLAASIRPLKQIEDAVVQAIDENAEIRDSASTALRKIRKHIGRLRDEIHGRLSRILQDGSCRNVIQDPVITIRDDRFVLPLKPNFRQSLKGIVHGQSGSRATLFVEPLAVLDQNNRLAELRMEEREEVQRILRELTSTVAQDAAPIEEAFGILTKLDAIQARARFGIECEGTVPELSADDSMQLREARHPLLLWKSRTTETGLKVVSNDLGLGGEHRLAIVSGPNTGGKTAILKTVGILSLMAQAGMPVTAAEGTALPVFSDLFADIGDEQSLEQNLSTFSSHVSQIAQILGNATKDSLVLLDELGAGTDPSEGAALGAAVLKGLLERGCMSIVTTHQSALKLFGSQTDGAVNAAMEFDSRTLEPTYRFIPGRPGRSYGFDIAARLGVPEAVIENARSRLSDDDARLANLLEQMERDARTLQSRREELEHELAAARRDRTAAEEERLTAEEEARAIKAGTKAEAGTVLTELRKRLKELMNSSHLDRSAAKDAAREGEALARQLEPPALGPRRTPSAPVAELHPGDRVTVAQFNKTGTVLASRRGVLEVEVEGKKLKLPSDEVTPARNAPRGQETGTPRGWQAELHEREGLPDSINVIGNHVPEAVAEVERHIDRAALGGFSSVTIIHGKGTGALREAVKEVLENHPLVASIRPGMPAEGGAGVTVAELKK